ncbi:HAD family phosphatase [Chitinophaga horti]|uniref:phosphoserine phosphatase n=1 Tax=Chitinophaga horti TaxID=2920382 RepID=A0ABY6IVD6_9BACT|nr:HAD family phosphatase [Chitinophaga horti]UYQ91335.1 HAD family phosphatase [Chitinophaga horti]
MHTGNETGLRKMMIFDMDNTLLQHSFIYTAAREFGFHDQLVSIVAEGLDDIPRTRKIATLLKGVDRRDIMDVATSMPLVEDAEAVVKELKGRGYTLGIISDSYDCVAGYLRQRLGMDFACANELIFLEDMATGEVVIPPAFLHQADSSCQHVYCKTNMMRYMMGVHGFAAAQVVAVGDGPNDMCMITHASTGVAFNDKTGRLKEVAKVVLPELSFRPLLEMGE